MKHGTFTVKGERPIVQVLTPAQQAVERRAKELLEGRVVNRVILYGDQLVLQMDNGGEFTMTCSGGFTEVN